MPNNAIPLITVCTPTLNVARYIDAVIESIVSQSFGDFEYLILDDESTDGTWERIQAWAKRDPRIKPISLPKTGPYVAAHHGVNLARGKYVARMDGDDVSLPNRFAAQVKFLEANPDHVLVGGQVELIDADGDPIAPMTCLPLDHVTIMHALLYRGWPLVHPAVMMRTETLRAVGNYRVDIKAVEDHDIFLKLGMAGKLANLPETVVQYRRHAASISVRLTETGSSVHRDVKDEVINEARAKLSMPPLSSSDHVEMDSIANGVDKERYLQYRRWVKSALNAGNRSTARKYARLAVVIKPLALESFRMLWRSHKPKMRADS